MSNIQEFEQIIANILSPDNNTRNQAEQYYNNSKSNPDFCVSSLVQLLRSSQQVDVRTLSCVLLRKCITKTEDSLYPHLSPDVQQMVKIQLLEALGNETVQNIRSKLVYTVSGFVSGLIEDNEYPEFLPTIFQWAVSENTSLRRSAMGIFNQLATYLLNKGLEPYLAQIHEVLVRCLQDSDNDVKQEAFDACCSVVTVIEKSKTPGFYDCIPLMLAVLAGELNVANYQAAASCIESLIEIAVSQTSYFKQHGNQVVTAMYQIASTPQIEDSVRHLAIEFMISLCENAPSIIRKIPNFIDNLLPLCMNLMLDIEYDEQEWANTYDDNDTELSNYDVGLESLDRLALSNVSPEQVATVAFKYIPDFINNKQDWKYRHTGLMAIAQTAEGCNEQYYKYLKEIVSMNVGLFDDPHPRVRYAAIHCAAQLSTDFTGHIQANFHQMIVPALLKGMGDPIPKVQSHAATAVVNFVEDSESKVIQPYLDTLLSKLLDLLKTGRRFVQEQSLSAISAIADCAETLFIQYYDHIVPFLKEILWNATGKQDRMLRARAIECVSLVGVAVGKEKFGSDARQIMEVLIQTQQQHLETDDPQIQHLHQGYTRIAKCLGEDFLPYLNFTVPPLLKSAALEPDVKVSDVDSAGDAHEEEGVESVTLSIKGVGDKVISIRTSTLEEKHLACTCLYSYVVVLKDGMLNYIKEIADIMVPLLKFPYMEDIRSTSATIMPKLIRAIKLAVQKGTTQPQVLKGLLDYIIQHILPALKVEPEVKTAIVLTESLNECIIEVGETCLNEEQIKEACEVLKIAMLHSLARKQSIVQDLEDEDDDEEQLRLEEESAEEEQLLTAVSELVGTLMKTHKQHIFNYFLENLWDTYKVMLQGDAAQDETRIALCVICDFVEQGPSYVAHDFDYILQVLLKNAYSENPEVRQAAVYGVGACAQYGGDLFVPHVQTAIKTLYDQITREDAKSKDSSAATCNAVSAFYKCFTFRESLVGDEQKKECLKVFLKALPVEGDVIEAKIVHNNLLSLIQQNNEVVVGDMTQVLRVFAYVVDNGLVTENAQNAIVDIVHQLQNQGLLQQLLLTLTPEEQTKLSKACSK
ncbi:hypothetical protein ABK040_001544 [Willaertia magna]